MSLSRYIEQAKAEYYCNVTEFIELGEGRELTRQENMHIRQKYRDVFNWYESLSLDGQLRIDNHLMLKYGN